MKNWFQQTWLVLHVPLRDILGKFDDFSRVWLAAEFREPPLLSYLVTKKSSVVTALLQLLPAIHKLIGHADVFTLHQFRGQRRAQTQLV